MKSGSLAYKCRYRRKLFYPAHTPDGPTVIRYLLEGRPIPSP